MASPKIPALAVVVSLAASLCLPAPSRAAAPGFCAYNSTTQTGWAAQTYKQVMFGTVKGTDTSGRYATVNSTWEPIIWPEQSEWVDINGQIQINSGIPTAGPQYVVAKVVKNMMSDIATGQVFFTPNTSGTATVPFHVKDLAQAGDYYWLVLYFDSIAAGGVVLDNNPAHTFWCGVVIK